MIILSHLKIGSVLYKNILRQYGVKLSKWAFIFGNTYPDLDPRVRKNPHNMEDCIYEIEQFKGDKIKNNMRKSFRLGIICHYVSDSFCAAHMLPEVYNSRDKHLTYEFYRWLKMNKELAALNVEELLPVAGGVGQFREQVQSCSVMSAGKVVKSESENLFKYGMMVMGILLAE